MTALACSLRRIWSAENRVPRLTGWGDSGLHNFTPRGWAREQVGQLVTLGHSLIPNLVVIVLTILR